MKLGKKVISLVVALFFLGLFTTPLFSQEVLKGKPILKEDLKNCQPRDKVLKDEYKEGYWNLRRKDWGGNNLLYLNVSWLQDVVTN